MTSFTATGEARRETVALTRSQIDFIFHEMGWESEDADIFWDLACRECEQPGSLEREARQYFERLLRHMDGGLP